MPVYTPIFPPGKQNALASLLSKTTNSHCAFGRLTTERMRSPTRRTIGLAAGSWLMGCCCFIWLKLLMPSSVIWLSGTIKSCLRPVSGLVTQPARQKERNAGSMSRPKSRVVNCFMAAIKTWPESGDKGGLRCGSIVVAATVRSRVESTGKNLCGRRSSVAQLTHLPSSSAVDRLPLSFCPSEIEIGTDAQLPASPSRDLTVAATIIAPSYLFDRALAVRPSCACAAHEHTGRQIARRYRRHEWARAFRGEGFCRLGRQGGRRRARPGKSCRGRAGTCRQGDRLRRRCHGSKSRAGGYPDCPREFRRFQRSLPRSRQQRPPPGRRAVARTHR